MADDVSDWILEREAVSDRDNSFGAAEIGIRGVLFHDDWLEQGDTNELMSESESDSRLLDDKSATGAGILLLGSDRIDRVDASDVVCHRSDSEDDDSLRSDADGVGLLAGEEVQRWTESYNDRFLINAEFALSLWSS